MTCRRSPPGRERRKRTTTCGRRQSQLARYGGRYLHRVLQIHRARRLTAHVARPHSDRELRDFARLNEGESSAAAMRRGVEFEWPYSKDHFKDRSTRLHGTCNSAWRDGKVVAEKP